MKTDALSASVIPRLPVLGWSTFTGSAHADLGCILDLPGARYTTSGRASILLALETLGVGPGHQVLLPTYHCQTMVAPVVHLGAESVFYPIDQTGAPVLKWLNAQDLSKARVLLVAHFFGLPQPLAEIRAWCDRFGIALIEDCAHALFGRSGERSIGTWGDLAIGSLTKFLPVSLGGCLVSNKPSLDLSLRPSSAMASVRMAVDAVEVAAEHRRLWGLNWAVPAVLATLRGLRGESAKLLPPPETVPASLPDQGALGGIDAGLAHTALPAVGRWMAQLVPRDRIAKTRRQRYMQYAQRLSGHRGLRPLMPDLPEGCAPYVFPLWVDQPDPGYARLRSQRMPVSRWDWLWPSVPQIGEDQGVVWSRHVLQLACHQDIKDADMDRFIDVLISLFAVGANTPYTEKRISNELEAGPGH